MATTLPSLALEDAQEASAGVDVPPPLPRREAAPPPRSGYVWVPGYWSWANQRHVWITGHWEPERRGCHWVRHHWVQRDGRWHLQPGGFLPDDAAS